MRKRAKRSGCMSPKFRYIRHTRTSSLYRISISVRQSGCGVYSRWHDPVLSALPVGRYHPASHVLTHFPSCNRYPSRHVEHRKLPKVAIDVNDAIEQFAQPAGQAVDQLPLSYITLKTGRTELQMHIPSQRPFSLLATNTPCGFATVVSQIPFESTPTH